MFLEIQWQVLKIVDFVEDSIKSRLILADILCSNKKRRMVPLSQFFFRVW